MIFSAIRHFAGPQGLLTNLATMLAYFVAGHVGLLLAVPPSNASPIWPPAGIALAVLLLYGPRVLPGIFAGAFLIHITAFLDASNNETLQQTLLVGLSTSLGSALQAWLGYLLLTRFIRPPLTLTHARAVVKFVVLGGMFACLTAATIGVTSLLLVKAFPIDVAPIVWSTWWVGDTVGVLIITPIVLAFFANPAGTWRPRRITVVLPLAVSLALTISFFGYATNEVHKRIEKDFQQQSQIAAEHVTRDLEEIIHSMIFSPGFDRLPEPATRTNLEQLLESNHPGIALLDQIAIYEIDPRGQWSLVGKQELHAHACTNEVVFSAESIAGAFRGATGKPLIRSFKDHCDGLQIFQPIHTAGDRKTGPAAMVVGLLTYENLVERYLLPELPHFTQVTLSLSTETGLEQVFANTGNEGAYAIETSFRPYDTQWVVFGGQPLLIHAVADNSFVADGYGWEAWFVLTGGLLFSSLLSIGLLVLTGRAAQTEALVTQRTAELAEEVDERRRAEQVLALQNEVLELIARDTLLQEVLDRICVSFEALSRPGTLASVMLVDPKAQSLRMVSGPSLPEPVFNALLDFPIGENEGSCGTAVHRGEQVICSNIAEDQEWEKYRDFALSQSLHACWSTPFFDRNGRTLGSFALTQTEARAPRDQDLQHIRTATFLCSLAVEQAHASSQMNTLWLAVEQSPSAVFIMDLNGNLEYANEHFSKLTQYTEEEAIGKHLRELLNTHDSEDYQTIWEHVLKGEEWTTIARNHRKDGSPYWAQCHITPVRNSSDEITNFLGIMQDVTELRESTEKITYQATHDQLTGLINRAEFERRLEGMLDSARLQDETHTLCFIDLDQFKIINDTNGHVAGDELLRQLGALMRQHIRKSDVLARIGGDEFAILFENCTSDEAVHNAEKIRTELAEHPFVWEGRTYNVGMSAGLTEITPHSPNTTELLREADAACYTSKETGRNRITVYSADEPTTAKRSNDMLWATRLREAIGENRLALYEQKIQSLRDGVADSTEILVRMLDKDGNEVPPGLFLPAAERYDISPALDAWVVRNTFDYLSKNPNFLANKRYCSINLSGLSFKQSFANDILGWLEEYSLPAEKICFEITETAAIANLSQASQFIEILSNERVLFALDDFGSGLSSFAYLKNLRVDILKIDGQFVRDMIEDPVDEAMVKAINEIGKVMAKTTVAEFVENDTIMQRLKTLGVDCAQGYGVARPKPLVENSLSKSA